MQFKKQILSNGLKLITVPMKDNPAVTVLVLVAAGSKYETKRETGLSHFLEHMVFKGTTNRPKASDISRELDSIGAHYNAFTSHEFTGYYAKVDKKHITLALDVVSDLYVDPLLDAGELEKEKGVIVEEIRMYQDMPQRHVQDLFMNLVYGDQPAGWNIAGTEESVKSFTREDFVRYRSRHYVAPATTVVIAGAFDEKTITTDVEKAFAQIHTGAKDGKLAVVEKQTEPQVKTYFRETDQTHLVLGVRSFPLTSPHDPTLHVLATVLGKGMSSRLFTKLRDEMGVCYYVKADHDAYTDHGVFTISAGVDNKRVEEVLKVLLAEMSRLVHEPVSDAELKKAKDFMLGSMVLGLETSDSQAEFVGMQDVVKGAIESLDDTAAKIRAVSAEQIQGVAKTIFKNEGLNLAVVGRYKDGEGLKGVVKF